MDSNKAASQSSNISSGIEISPPYDSEVDTYLETNALNNNNNSKSLGSGSISGSDGEDGGFVSGEEEFETASERPVVADPDEETLEEDVEGENLSEVYVGVSEILTPRTEMPVAVSTADDDVEKGDRVEEAPEDDIEGENFSEVFVGGSEMLTRKTGTPLAVATPEDDVEKGPEVTVFGGGYGQGDGIETGKEYKGVGGMGSGSTGAIESEAIAAEGFLGKPEAMVEENSGENSNLNQVVEEAIAAEGAGKPEVMVEPISGESSNLNQLVEEAIIGEGISDKPEVMVEPISDKSCNLNQLVEGAGLGVPKDDIDEVSTGSHGDNVVEISEVDEIVGSEVEGSLMPGEVEMEETKLKDEKASDAEYAGTAVEESSVASQINNVTLEPTNSKLVETDGVKFTNEGNSVVEAIHVNMSEPGVVVVGEVEANKDSGIKGPISSVMGSVGLVNGSDQTIHVDNADDADFDQHIATSGDRNLEVSESKPSGWEIEQEADSGAKQNETTEKVAAGGVKTASVKEVDGADGVEVQAMDSVAESVVSSQAREADHLESNGAYVNHLDEGFAEEDVKNQTDEERDIGGSGSDGETDGMIFGSSEAARQFIEELEQGSGAGSHSGAESFRDQPQRIDGQIVTDSDEEVDTDEEGDGKELFDSAALAALLKAATGAGSDGGNITITSQDGSRLFSIERPAGLGSSARSFRPATRPNRSDLFTSSGLTTGSESEANLTEEEKKKMEKLQLIRVKFLRLVHRLGVSTDEAVAAQVLYRLALVGGRQNSQTYSLDAAKRTAIELEAEGKDDLDFSVNILVLGKSGVGKSATINSIFGEEKSSIDAFAPATTTVKEISGVVDGVKIKVFDTPGLKSAVMEQAFNRRVLSSATKITKKNPPDIVLYVDRLDSQTRDLNDLPLLKTITSSLGPSIWRSAIVTLTHAASAPPDGPSGSPLSYEVFVTQRSHVVQQSIGQAVGDLRMMSPSLMNPVSLVENHPLCRKNREGQKVLPNGQTWRPQLLLLCYSMKILSEASSLSKPQDPFDHRKLFGFRARSPPLPYLLSSMLQTRAHPKLSTEQGGETGDSDIDLSDLLDADEVEGADEYDRLPPFQPQSKAQIGKYSEEERKRYFEEYDQRVMLLHKKQWSEELKRMREMKKKGKDAANESGEGADLDDVSATPVSTPLPDMVLPPSFDSDSPAYRYRFLEPNPQLTTRPVLDTHGWDHDCGYDGVNLEQSLAIANRFPAAISFQITKDKKDFSIHLDSSVAAKHGENGSSMAGFDIQTIGKQLAYIVRGETKLKNLEKNKTAAGVTVTFLGENVATGLKIEDQIAWGKQWSLVGSAGTVRCQGDAAYGANFELQRWELDYPIGQVQSTYGLSLIKWRGDWALGFNTVSQFSIGLHSKVAVRAGINNKLSGQITVRTSSSEHLSLALASIIPIVSAIYKKIRPAAADNYSIY